MITNTFLQLSSVAGSFVTTFIMSIFVLSMLRIAIAFVFRIMRLNLDYKAVLKKTGKT